MLIFTKFKVLDKSFKSFNEKFLLKILGFVLIDGIYNKH